MNHKPVNRGREPVKPRSLGSAVWVMKCDVNVSKVLRCDYSKVQDNGCIWKHPIVHAKYQHLRSG